MLIKGINLYLRTIRESDLDTLYELSCDIEARGHYFPIFISSETAFRHKFKQTGFWSDDHGDILICDLNDRILGMLHYFKAAPYFDGLEVAYRLYDTGQSNRGIMTEALCLCTYMLFISRKINRLELKIMPDNVPSKRVAKNCGYKLEGVARGAIFHRGEFRDMEVYSILREEVPATLEDSLARFKP